MLYSVHQLPTLGHSCDKESWIMPWKWQGRVGARIEPMQLERAEELSYTEDLSEGGSHRVKGNTDFH